VKAAKTVGEGHKQPASALSGKSVMFDLREPRLVRLLMEKGKLKRGSDWGGTDRMEEGLH